MVLYTANLNDFVAFSKENSGKYDYETIDLNTLLFIDKTIRTNQVLGIHVQR